MKKLYKVTKGTCEWVCEIEIEHSTETNEGMKAMIEFWMGGDDNLANNNGDITKTFLQQLAREIYRIIIEYNYNEAGVISEFNSREGWCKMDGSYGIKIISVEPVEISLSDFMIKEVQP